MFKVYLLNYPRLIEITQTLYTLSIKSTFILAVRYLPHSLLHISFNCAYPKVCYLE